MDDLKEVKQLKAKVQIFPPQFIHFMDGEVVP